MVCAEWWYMRNGICVMVCVAWDHWDERNAEMEAGGLGMLSI